MDDARVLNRIANRPLPVYATERTLTELKTRFGYAFRPWDPPHFYRPVLEAHPIVYGGTLDVLGLSLRLFEQNHGKVDSLGIRIGAFGYSTDVVKLNDAAFETLAGIDTWVVDCFLRTDPHWTHANLTTVIDWVQRLKPRRTILTHMGTDMDWAWLAANLPPGIEAGYDGMVIAFN
jgi:phosphoribosyl 1,2-cyclic phosphate phosphodiesterase